MAVADQHLDVPLRLDDHPGLFQAADQASLAGQRRFLHAVRARLTLSILAAVSAAFTVQSGPADWAAVVTALCFVGTLGVEVLVLRGRPSKTWYQGRALAESAKSLTWRYAVGGDPFPLELSPAEADKRFTLRLQALHTDFPDVQLLPTQAPAISEPMRALRQSALPERRRVYLLGRVDDQRSWYATKARFHQQRASLYRLGTIIFEITGIAVALSRALGLITFDLAGIVAAVIAAIAAWSATRQHDSTAEAYVVANHDLGLLRERLHHHTDDAWADAVADTEAAISREHSTWRSSHNE
ncbi:DUF4231 domain-containing protein [Saccharopolyspora aridisoli]|uniref:DUF4231 domain-containing protein n=1 Tax=Saccharopolyspora aridisoli TaxID=2530385 RepID=A0A4R4UCI0_9PSEU|nr:DUF4231 domain-containing protein [Saccharopolyspora aridisoli]TDC89298.1 DUF4231 domain-containing protein [Saccharopolyspora aridisoli]